MSLGTVTIAIPTFRRPTKLRRAIQSVLDQTYSDLRVIVYDNASGDETKDVAAEFMRLDPRVGYICHATNIGFVDNFNFAFQQVTTPFFGLLTDDDYYLPEFLTNGIRAFEQYPQISVSIQSAPFKRDDGTLLSDQLDEWPREGLYSPGESIAVAIDGSHPIFTMCIFRLAVKNEIFFSKLLDSICDIPVLISLLSKHHFHISRSIGGYFLQHDAAIGAQFSRVENTEKLAQAFLTMEHELNIDTSIPVHSKLVIKAVLRRRIDKQLFYMLLNNATLKNSAIVKALQKKIRSRRLSSWQLSSLMLSFIAENTNGELLGNALATSREWLRRVRRSPANKP